MPRDLTLLSTAIATLQSFQAKADILVGMYLFQIRFAYLRFAYLFKSILSSNLRFLWYFLYIAARKQHMCDGLGDGFKNVVTECKMAKNNSEPFLTTYLHHAV